MAIGTPHLYGNKKWKGLEYTLVLGNKTTNTIYVIQYTPNIRTYIHTYSIYMRQYLKLSIQVYVVIRNISR